MIKEEKVLIKINIRNITYYRNLNYDINGKELLVDIKDLNPSSKVRITATCELCGNEKELLYCKYVMNKNRNDKGFYSCFKCKNIEKEKRAEELSTANQELANQAEELQTQQEILRQMNEELEGQAQRMEL
jgi:DNA-directed RNA polymerase subunit M/transcription elongation factor TFIIS